MRHRSIARVVGTATLVGAVASLATTSVDTLPAAAQADRGNVDGTLVIGSLAPQTGELSTILESLRLPVQLAVQEINDAGGVNDVPVALVDADDGSTVDVARASVDRLANVDKVDAIVGPSASPVALGILDDLRSDRILTCAGSNMSADLSRAPTGGYYFRTSPPDRLQGQALADLVLSDGHDKVAIVHRNDAYGTQFDEILRKALANGGAKVVADVGFDPTRETFDKEVAKVAEKKPRAVIVIALDTDGAAVVRSMIAAGIGPATVPLYTVDGMLSASFAVTLDPADPAKAAGIKGTQPASSPAGTDSPFLATFATTGTDPVFSAYYYDCTILVALAAEKAGTDNPAKMRKAFTSNLLGKRDCDTFAACKKLLDDGKTIHWRGASSNFDKFGDFEPDEGVYDVWSYDATGRVQIEDASSQIAVG